MATKEFFVTIIKIPGYMWYTKLGEEYRVTEGGPLHYNYKGNKIIFKSDCVKSSLNRLKPF